MTRYLTDLVQRIETMRDEAAAVGDDAQAALCDRALDGHLDAIAECSRVLREADARRGVAS